MFVMGQFVASFERLGDALRVRPGGFVVRMREIVKTVESR
jgi:hypothetical protein